MSTTKNVNLPDIGDFDSADVIEILVKIGDLVKENDSIITLETDKATMEIPAPFSGKITNLAMKVGDKVSHGDLILTVESDSEPAEIESEPSVISKEPKPEVGLEDSTQAKDKPNKLDQKKEEISLDTEPGSHASPSIRKLARELGVSLSKISGSGQKGRILAEDLKSYVKQIVTTGNVDDEVEIIPLSRIKKISGKHLTQSWTTIPHVTQFDEVNIEQMEQFRQHQKERNIKLSPLVFIMKAVVQVLKNHPNFNASLDENGENLVIKKYFNLGIAVDTPNGLVVPVVRDVGKKSLIELAKELKETSERAREGLLKPEEMRDAGFTISSLGGIGGTQFTPIINSPQVAILGVSRIQIKAIWNGETFEPTAILPLALSYDHRVIDGVKVQESWQISTKILEILRRCYFD